MTKVRANDAQRMKSPKSYTEMTRMFVDGGESPYRRSTKSPSRSSSRSGQRAVADLRRELQRRHVTTGQLFSMMDQDRSDGISIGEFSRGVAMCGIRPVPNESEMRALFESFDLDRNRQQLAFAAHHLPTPTHTPRPRSKAHCNPHPNHNAATGGLSSVCVCVYDPTGV